MKANVSPKIDYFGPVMEVLLHGTVPGAIDAAVRRCAGLFTKPQRQVLMQELEKLSLYWEPTSQFQYASSVPPKVAYLLATACGEETCLELISYVASGDQWRDCVHYTDSYWVILDTLELRPYVNFHAAASDIRPVRIEHMQLSAHFFKSLRKPTIEPPEEREKSLAMIDSLPLSALQHLWQKVASDIAIDSMAKVKINETIALRQTSILHLFERAPLR